MKYRHLNFCVLNNRAHCMVVIRIRVGKMHCLGFILVAVILKLVSSESGSVKFTDKNGNNFRGKIIIPIQKNVQGGWNVVLKFQKPVFISQVWGAKKIEETKKEYRFENEKWNPNLPAGFDLAITFLSKRYSYRSDPSSTVTLLRKHPKKPNCPSITLSRGVYSQKADVKIYEDWPGAFKAKVSIITMSKVDQWTIYLKFSQEINNIQVPNAKFRRVDRKYFIISKKQFLKKNLKKGEKLEIEFIAYFNGARLPCITALFAWKGGSHLTTSRPTGQPTSEATTFQSSTDAPTASQPSTGQSTNTIPTQLPTTSQSTSTVLTTVPIQSTNTMVPITTKPVTGKSPYNYSEVLHKSILFYEAQRSGYLPSTNRISWRGNSATSDQGENGEDLVGGWYDAGDHVKFGFPMAFSTTLLTWGLLEYRDAYVNAGELENMLSCIKWPLDYFLKAHVKPDVLYGQVGDGNLDHSYWGRPELMTMRRPAFKITKTSPGSDLAAETAAAMAAGSLAFRSTQPSYAKQLLKHAKELFLFADNYRGLYTQSIPNAGGFYNSASYNDELVWGALWLYKATNDKSYLTKAESYFKSFGLSNPGWGFSWDEKIGGLQLMLYQLTKKRVYKDAIEKTLNFWLPGGGITYTPEGLAWRLTWGPNRYAANTAFLSLVAADHGLNTKTYRDFGKNQIHFMLGDNGRSFVVGFGKNPPVYPHHRGSSCAAATRSCNINDPKPNPNILYGALVGGPDKNDNYNDRRQDYVMNEVATDYNAGFQSAVAALKALK